MFYELPVNAMLKKYLKVNLTKVKNLYIISFSFKMNKMGTASATKSFCTCNMITNVKCNYVTTVMAFIG